MLLRSPGASTTTTATPTPAAKATPKPKAGPGRPTSKAKAQQKPAAKAPATKKTKPKAPLRGATFELTSLFADAWAFHDDPQSPLALILGRISLAKNDAKDALAEGDNFLLQLAEILATLGIDSEDGLDDGRLEWCKKSH